MEQLHSVIESTTLQRQDDSVLTDQFGRVHNYLRISLTDRCNLRCTYCMPEENMKFAIPSSLMSADEVVSLATLFVELGVNKIRLTGGEPLVRADAAEIITRLSKLPVELSMTTNGTRLHLFLDTIQAAGLKSINISLDTFNAEKFQKLTRRNEFETVMQNIYRMLNCGIDLKINVVLMRGVNDDEIEGFTEFARENKVGIRFIEFMPFPGNHWDLKQVVSYAEVLEKIAQKHAVAKLIDEKHATSKLYGIPGYQGTFGFINTVTLPFCGDCNRLRLTADGRMKNCLFSTGEIDLLGPLRKGENIIHLIAESVRLKKKQTGGQDFSLPTTNRSMIAIGG